MALYAFLICSLAAIANGCSIFPIDPCENVTCKTGQICVPRHVYCPDQPVTICQPKPQCIDLSDPCRNTRCPSGTLCVTVADRCGSAGCRIRAQCNAVVRRGRCPRPPIPVHSCMMGCTDDHLCPVGEKCCRTSTDSDQSRFCVKMSNQTNSG